MSEIIEKEIHVYRITLGRKISHHASMMDKNQKPHMDGHRDHTGTWKIVSRRPVSIPVPEVVEAEA